MMCEVFSDKTRCVLAKTRFRFRAALVFHPGIGIVFA